MSERSERSERPCQHRRGRGEAAEAHRRRGGVLRGDRGYDAGIERR
jgi:hypothetical protein